VSDMTPPPPTEPAPGYRRTGGVDMATLTSGFTTAELLILGGSLLLWAVQILFAWVMGETAVDQAWLALAFILAGAVLFQRRMNVDMGTRYTQLLILAGLALGALALSDLILSVRLVGLPSDGVRLIDWVLQWVGGLAVGAGGFLAWSRR
jgi:hypothetical protein